MRYMSIIFSMMKGNIPHDDTSVAAEKELRLGAQLMFDAHKCAWGFLSQEQGQNAQLWNFDRVTLCMCRIPLLYRNHK